MSSVGWVAFLKYSLGRDGISLPSEYGWHLWLIRKLDDHLGNDYSKGRLIGK